MQHIRSDFPSTLEKVRLIAFFLTQFHPTPENDRWWGKGFTEWTNVTRARPLFAGHNQPRLPSDLGFYDLRLRDVRHEQIALARQYGVDGFCYHYYWFSGTRLLNRPLDDMLADPESNMPFCLCWANESWTRRWDATAHEILITQRHLPDDDLNFIKDLIPFFEDPRYIRLNGAPLLIVYRPQNLPDPRHTVEVWRQYCKDIGIDTIHVCAALTYGNRDYTRFGFDSGVEFPPHNLQGASVNPRIDFHAPFYGNVMEYDSVADSYLNRKYQNANVFRAVCPSWDNTARTGRRALVLLNETPANYEYWLAESIRRTVQDFPEEERFVFINAWNEWAEGCYLEPDQRFQRGFLEATLRAKTGQSERRTFEHTALPSRQEGSARTLMGDLIQILSYHLALFLGRVRLTTNRFPRLKGILIRGLRIVR
jgi:lipopolysaccharide biosynthesis protein